MKPSSKKAKRAQNNGAKNPSPIANSSISARSPTAPSEKDWSQWYVWGAICLIAISVFLIYSNSYSGEFIYDDAYIIQANPTITDLWRKSTFNFSSQELRPGVAHVISIRPVTNWTFALNYALGGFNVFGYHLFNVLLHLSSALLIFGIVRRTLLTDRLKATFGKHAVFLACGIALLWACHPLATNAVNYITQRLEVLASFFYLATLYCFIRGQDSKRGWFWFLLAIITAFLGMGSKEMMVTAPVVILLYDRTFFSGSFIKAIGRHPEFYAGLLASWLFLGMLLLTGQQGSIGSSDGRGGSSDTWSYAATQLGVVLHYLRLTFWPDPLIFDYYWPTANTISAILLPGIVIALMGIVIVWGIIKNQTWAFVGACFFIILSPSSSFVPIVKEYICEYRMYLALLAPATLFVLGIYRLHQYCLTNFFSEKFPDPKVEKWGYLTLMIILGIIVITFAMVTHQRNKDYETGITIWSDTVKKDPLNARAQYAFSYVLYVANDLEKAIFHVKEAIKLNPNYAEAFDNYGVYLEHSGRCKEAIEKFKQALEVNPKLTMARSNLGLCLYEEGDFRMAANEFRMAHNDLPNDPEITHRLEASLIQWAVQLMNAGNKSSAVGPLTEVRSLNPNNADVKKLLPIASGR